METVVVTLQEAARLALQNACAERVFRDNESKAFLALQETLQNWPGSKPRTTRRFTHKWQDDTAGFTKSLYEARSSVCQR
jgi:hypothetical protein